MVQLITLADQPYIVDVGFGGMTPTGLLRLEVDTEQTTPHEPFRFVMDEGDFVMEALVAGTWRALYRFDLTEQRSADYEVSNFWVCNHPDSHFISGISAARVEPGRRYALRNNQFTVYQTNGPSEERQLTSVQELREVLDNDFHITIPSEVDADAALRRLISE